MKKIKFYMKSGNSFTLDNVDYWEVESSGNVVTSLSIKLASENSKERLIISSIDLTQIEAITEVK